MINKNFASWLRRIRSGKRHGRRQRASFRFQLLQLEDRRLLSAITPLDIPIPAAQIKDHTVDLDKIFWNGGDPINSSGVTGLMSPDAEGAGKTITITNYSPDPIYPYLRSANNGKTNGKYYDPQDLHAGEFREYVGYSKDGSQFLGLPSGATITFEVPLVLWDGDNVSLVTDGTDLTTPLSAPRGTLFGYDPTASIHIAKSGESISGSTWVQSSANFPKDTSPLAMFYYSSAAPLTTANAAPSQLAELTFRDPYLKKLGVTNTSQTFALLNYDLSYVNTTAAPAAMEASNVPIITGSIAGGNLHYYQPNQDFGWHGSKKDQKTFEALIADFVHNTGKASIGSYFGGKGWPQYYNPNPDDFIIPSGANVFDDSSLDFNVGRAPVHVSNYDSNRFLLSSSNKAPIQAGGAGVGDQGIVHPDSPNKIFLNNPPATFFTDLEAMLKAGAVNVSLPSSPANVLSTVKSFNAKPQTGMPFVILDSPIAPNAPSGDVYQFTRTAKDYASTTITNLWYSWAKYYVNQFSNKTPPNPISGDLVFKNPDTGGPGTTLTNEIKLSSAPSAPLAVGMTVTGSTPGSIPAGTTILKIVGNTIYLSQMPAANAPMTQTYTFGNPQELPIDAISAPFTKPFELKFSAAEKPNALRFAASVYETMQAESIAPKPSPTLPTTLNVVDNVIKFNADLPGHDLPWGHILVGEVRDIVKSILRGVYDFNQVPDQSKWYPEPDKPTGGQTFNVYNLDPYVWFVHTVEGLTGYGFSVDDDVANPSATGPTEGDDTNHDPNNLQIGFGGIKGEGKLKDVAKPLGNQQEWFPTTRFGKFETTAKIGVWNGPGHPEYNGYSVITLTDPTNDLDKIVRTLNKIITPGEGQIGAYISAPGYIVPGTTLIFFPAGVTDGTKADVILSQKAISTGDKSIPVTIDADAKDIRIPKVPLKNPSFAAPPQTSPPFYTINPKDPDGFGNLDSTIFWKFTGTAGISGNGSIYTKNNPAPAGSQVAFIQNVGSISQSVMLAPGKAYAVSFLVSQRVLDDKTSNSQTLRVKVGNKVIGEFEPKQTADGSYLLFTSDAFTVNTAGMYNIVIEGTNTKGGDNTALIDQVIITG
jgi:hypothetical protein